MSNEAPVMTVREIAALIHRHYPAWSVRRAEALIRFAETASDAEMEALTAFIALAYSGRQGQENTNT